MQLLLVHSYIYTNSTWMRHYRAIPNKLNHYQQKPYLHCRGCKILTTAGVFWAGGVRASEF